MEADFLYAQQIISGSGMLPGSSAEGVFGNPEETVSSTFVVLQTVLDFAHSIGADRTVKFAVVAAGMGLTLAIDYIAPEDVAGIISDSDCHTAGGLAHCAPIPFVIGIAAPEVITENCSTVENITGT